MIENMTKHLDEVAQRNYLELQKEQVVGMNRASSAGWVFDCERNLVLQRLVPSKATPLSIDQIRRFIEGRRQEEIMRADMVEAGFVMEKPTGKLIPDLKLKLEADDIIVDGPSIERPCVVDYKSCSEGVYNQISGITDAQSLFESKMIWVRHYPIQINLYQVAEGIEDGLLQFKNKSSGEKVNIPAVYDKATMDSCFAGLKRVNRYVENKEAPPAREVRACYRCAFASTVCFTKGMGLVKAEAEVEVLSDQEAEVLLEQRDSLIKAHKEYKGLDDKLKKMFRGRNVLVGRFIIKSTEYESTTYKIPDEMKAQFKEMAPRVRVDISSRTEDEMPEL